MDCLVHDLVLPLPLFLIWSETHVIPLQLYSLTKSELGASTPKHHEPWMWCDIEPVDRVRSQVHCVSPLQFMLTWIQEKEEAGVETAAAAQWWNVSQSEHTATHCFCCNSLMDKNQPQEPDVESMEMIILDALFRSYFSKL